MRFSTQVHIDVAGHMGRVRSDELWRFAAQQWHRLYAPYVPRDTGRLCEDVRISPGQIEHVAPYAARVYYGSFSSSGRASRQWDRAAEPGQKPKLAGAMQAYVDSGRLNFGG